MKYCEEYAALLDGFADGELPAAEMERVRAHLETCPGCRAYADDLLVIRAEFPDAEVTEVPEGFAEGVMKRVRADVGFSRFRRWTGTLGMLAACCALVVALRGDLSKDARTPVAIGAGPCFPDTTSVTGDTAETTDAGEPEAYVVTGGAEENGTMARTTPEEPMDEGCAVAESGAAESQMAAMDREDESSAEKKHPTANAALPAAAAVPDVMEEADAGVLLYLSNEEAGDLLEGFTPAWETESERGYELSGGECEALLEGLGWEDEALPESVVVVVTAPNE